MGYDAIVDRLAVVVQRCRCGSSALLPRGASVGASGRDLTVDVEVAERDCRRSGHRRHGCGRASSRGTSRATCLCDVLRSAATHDAMAIEARPYALSSMFMAAALLFVVMARRKLAWWGWLLLVMSMVGAVAMQLYAAFPIAGLVVASWFFLKGRARWLVTIAAAFSAAILSPFLWLSYQQIGQSSWLADQKFSLANRFLVESWATSRVNAAPTVTDLTPGRVALAMQSSPGCSSCW